MKYSITVTTATTNYSRKAGIFDFSHIVLLSLIDWQRSQSQIVKIERLECCSSVHFASQMLLMMMMMNF